MNQNARWNSENKTFVLIYLLLPVEWIAYLNKFKETVELRYLPAQ